MNDPIRVGIVGGAGYTAGELCRLLLNHPEAEIVFVNSESNAGNRLTDVHAGLYGETDLCFTDQLPFEEVDVVYFCFGHGKSTRFLEEHYVPADVRIIDLAQDFRLAAEDNDYVYGLPELNGLQLRGAQHVANPGCFATCIQLGLLPLAKAGVLEGDISVNAITGSTGAGVKPAATTHFSWRSGNMSIYKAFNHQHVPEIRQSLCRLQPEFDGSIDFIPYRGDFPRGIFATEVVRCDLPEAEVVQLYKEFYAEAPFTHYVDGAIDMKQVVNTNKCLVHVDKHGDKLLITSCIDNLLKGASGQAVQNMNLMFGLEETTGLRLKPIAF
ncbi:MAG: N-acetyl-gamma-glutamyl-phosphate reductase [Bacteroidaceae bacterium]|nr:N-acetyl-gamma-glutamyl-phosphate reductase [Bacteroidaceae bacterium]